ncbi:DUF4266 domain-containing protein [Shewanella psychrophila]|nr:DUF4266 domain-containing protein [Shewanella psychrophila]
MKYKLSLISALVSVSFGATATLEIDLSGLDEKSQPTEAKGLAQSKEQSLIKGFGTVAVQGSTQETVSANGRYHQSTSVSSSVYSSQGAVIGMRRNVELAAPKRPNLMLSAPEVLANDNAYVDLAPQTLSPELFPERVPEIEMVEVAETEDDESMLSFIDEWLGIEPVKPWEKGTLAEKAMKPGGVVPEFDRFSEKVFSYKQGSVGGSGVGGGGCGCN